jgi:hypothetical protein
MRWLGSCPLPVELSAEVVLVANQRLSWALAGELRLDGEQTRGGRLRTWHAGSSHVLSWQEPPTRPWALYHRLIGVSRLPGGSKKGVYRLTLDDDSTVIVYIWDNAENY